MRVTKDQAQRSQHGATCKIYKYMLPSENLSLVTAEISGRYPEKGKVLNEVCEETYFVTSGSCIIHHQSGVYSLRAGDVFFFPKGQWWWVEAEGLDA